MEVLVLQFFRVFVELPVHLPEFVLSCGRFGSLSRAQGLRMNFYQRKMTVHKSYAVEEFVKHLFEHAMSVLTIGALIVTVVNDRYQRVGWTNRMVTCTYRKSEIHGRNANPKMN